VSDPALVTSAEEIVELLARVFPQITGSYDIVELSWGSATIEYRTDDRHLRPGGTVSGPAMFGAADLAFYVALLGMIGPKALAVTTGANINFMRKPPPGPLRADARVLKLGTGLAVGDVTLFGHGLDKPVAHAQMTYSIPRRAP